MRLLHMSDSHERFFNFSKERFEAILHTGDLLPDASLHDLKDVPGFQGKWVERHLEDFKKMIDGKPFLFTLGNHDFLRPEVLEQILNAAGIQAINLQEKIVSYGNVNFYGFPFVPHINGEFNYELSSGDMAVRVDQMAEALNKTYVDVIAAHAPISNYLDVDGQNQHFGNSAMAIGLDYKIDKEMLPSFYLHGHVHKARGIAHRNGMTIINSATGYTMVEI